MEEARLSRRHAARLRQNPREDAVAKPAGDRLLPCPEHGQEPERRRRDELHLDRADPPPPRPVRSLVRALAVALARTAAILPITAETARCFAPGCHRRAGSRFGAAAPPVSRAARPIAAGLRAGVAVARARA